MPAYWFNGLNHVRDAFPPPHTCACKVVATWQPAPASATAGRAAGSRPPPPRARAGAQADADGGRQLRRGQLRHVRARVQPRVPVRLAQRAHQRHGRRPGGRRARAGAVAACLGSQTLPYPTVLACAHCERPVRRATRVCCWRGSQPGVALLGALPTRRHRVASASLHERSCCSVSDHVTLPGLGLCEQASEKAICMVFEHWPARHLRPALIHHTLCPHQSYPVPSSIVPCATQVEEAKRQRQGKPWPQDEQAAFKAAIVERCLPPRPSHAPACRHRVPSPLRTCHLHGCHT